MAYDLLPAQPVLAKSCPPWCFSVWPWPVVAFKRDSFDIAALNGRVAVAAFFHRVILPLTVIADPASVSPKTAWTF